MKQLIFTLTLLPFLAVYPAGKSANASAAACATDIKRSAAAKAARDEKAQSATARVDALETQLFPNISLVFNNILGMEQELMKKFRGMCISRAQYRNADKPALLPPLWEIVYDYAISNHQVTGETFRELFPIADIDVIDAFAQTVVNLMKETRFIWFLSTFHQDTKLGQRWPYDSESFKYFLNHGFKYEPGQLYLNRFIPLNGKSNEYAYLQPWYRVLIPHQRASLGEHQFDEDPVIEFRNQMDRYQSEIQQKANSHESSAYQQYGDTYVRHYDAWNNVHILFGLAASWKRVMGWVSTQFPEAQQQWRDELAFVLPNYRDC